MIGWAPVRMDLDTKRYAGRSIHRSLTLCAWDPSLVAGCKAVFHKSRGITPSPGSADCMKNEAPGRYRP